MNEPTNRIMLTRRQGMGLAAAIAGVFTLPACASVSNGQSARAGPGISFATRIDFLDPVWNRDTYARVDGELDFTKQKVSRITGTVNGVRDNEAVRPLFAMDGFSVVRTMRLPDGNWRRLLKEIVFYRDIKTGQIMKEWENPYTEEMVRVVPIANDPFNYDIRDTMPEGPSYGGINDTQRNAEPFLLNWTENQDQLIINTGIDLFYPASLQPSQWPRESAGSWNRVSEHFLFFMDKAHILDPAVTAIPVTGAWSRITPWLPWMLMGQAPGFINYFTHFHTVRNGIAGLPEDLVKAAIAVDPGYLEAPTEDYGPSLSSLENFKLTEKPAPMPPGWSAPQPPQPPPLPAFMNITE